MTREEAIEKLKVFAPMVVDDTREALDMAIEALQRKEHLVELEAKAVAIIKSERHGEWVASRVGESSSWFVECSKCHVVMPPANYTFCPNCGAKMYKEIEDNGTE